MWGPALLFALLALLVGLPSSRAVFCDSSYTNGPNQCPAGCAYGGEADDYKVSTKDDYACSKMESHTCSCCDQWGSCANNGLDRCWGTNAGGSGASTNWKSYCKCDSGGSCGKGCTDDPSCSSVTEERERPSSCSSGDCVNKKTTDYEQCNGETEKCCKITWDKRYKCVACEVGQYKGNPSSSDTSDDYDCQDCPAGRYNEEMRGTSLDSCDLCDEGKYSGVKAFECISCPAGKHASAKGQGECEICPAGRYQENEGEGERLRCFRRS